MRPQQRLDLGPSSKGEKIKEDRRFEFLLLKQQVIANRQYACASQEPPSWLSGRLSNSALGLAPREPRPTGAGPDATSLHSFAPVSVIGIQREVVAEGIVAQVSGSTLWRWLCREALSFLHNGGQRAGGPSATVER
jgi:hypothetical protein